MLSEGNVVKIMTKALKTFFNLKFREQLSEHRKAASTFKKRRVQILPVY